MPPPSGGLSHREHPRPPLWCTLTSAKSPFHSVAKDGWVFCAELCLHQNPYMLKFQIPVPPKVTVFGDRDFQEEGHEGGL